MKKIVIIHHVGNLGGGTISLIDVCKMLHENYKLVVFLPKYNSEKLTNMLKQYATVQHYNQVMPLFSYYSGSEGILTRGFFQSFFVPHRDIKSLCKGIADEAPDIILANSVIQCRMGKYLKNVNAKKIIYIRETFLENLISRYMISVINKYFDGALCISPYEKNYAKFKIPTEVVADCFTSKIEKTRHSKSSSKFRVLFMGGNSPIKGLNVLAAAIPYINNKNVVFDICGNLSFMPSTFKNRILHHKIIKNESVIQSILKKYRSIIICHGFVRNVNPIFTNCDAVVFPSTYPHQARPAIEAGAYGKPVIISDFKQTNCFYQNGENCLTFKAGDSVALANAIYELSVAETLAKDIGQRNQESCYKNHDFKTEQKKLLKFLENQLKDL